jgi:PAS domain S-box-containing protein
MNWATATWSMVIGGCATMALPFLLVGIKQRRTEHLFFVLVAVGIIWVAIGELTMMHANSVDQFEQAMRWTQVAILLLVMGLVGFVYFYFGTARLWLGFLVCLASLVCVVLSFVFRPNLNFREITALRHVPFLGASLSVPVGVVSPWTHFAELTNLLFLTYAVDASIGLWRRGETRRRALVLGGSITFFILLAAGLKALTNFQIIPLPYSVSFVFAAILLAMAFELSYDLLAAAEIARRLRLSEASRQESEERFRVAADAAPVLIWMSGTDKLCDFFNKPWLDFTGRTMEQEMGNGWAEGVHPDDLRRCHQTYTAAFEAREPFTMQYRLRRHDGEYRWISDTGVPRYGAQKNFAGYIGSCVDVTELISKEQALRESEERMSLALDEAHLGLWEWHAGSDELWGTQARRSLLGLQSGKIKLEEGLSRVHEGDRDKVRQMLMDAAKTGKNYHQEYRVLLADGRVRWTEHRGRCVKGEDGKVVLLRGLSIDVTERKGAEEKFRLAVEASPSGIVLVDGEGNISLVNRRTELMFGYDRNELIGKPVEMLVPERFASGHSAYRAKFLAAPEARAMGAGRELFGHRKDGSEFPVEIGLNPIQTPEGSLVLASIVDISARKRTEGEAQRRRDEINRLTRVSLVGEMAGSIAHEVNQPLGAMMANASAGVNFIDRGDVDAQRLREILAAVVSDGRRARDVINNVRATIKKGAVVRPNVALNDIVRNVMHMVEPDAATLSCELQASLAEYLPTIEADPIQIQQVLINLIGNAFDAMRGMPSANRKIEIATHQDDGLVRVTVRDHGTGIGDMRGEQLFEQFYTTKEEGLGMGLAIVRSIIQAHSGTIKAENAEGGGARFAFALPVSDRSSE